MKNRIIFLILILGLLFISGCINSQPKKIKKNYTENDLDNIYLYINNFELSLNLSNDTTLKNMLLSVELYESKSDVTYEVWPDLVLNFKENEFVINSDKSIIYISNDKEIAVTASNNDFDYLYTLFNFTELDFSKYNNPESIKVFNSKNDSAEISENADFLANLNKIKYIQLNHKDNYDLGELKFKIVIDEDTINIYNDYMVINDNLYVLTEGSFVFLNNLKYGSSSGWLPWV